MGIEDGIWKLHCVEDDQNVQIKSGFDRFRDFIRVTCYFKSLLDCNLCLICWKAWCCPTIWGTVFCFFLNPFCQDRHLSGKMEVSWYVSTNMYQQICTDFPLFSMIVRVLTFAAKLAPTQRTIYPRLIHWLEVISYPVLQRVINHIKRSQLGWNGIHQLVGVLFSAKQFHKLHCLYLSSMLQPVDLVRH